MIELAMIAGQQAAAALTEIKIAATRFPGDHELRLLVSTPDDYLRGRVTRTVVLGPDWQYDGSAACLAALGEFGTATLHDE